MRIDEEPWKQLQVDTDALEISHPGQVKILPTHECKSSRDHSTPRSCDANEEDSDDEDLRKYVQLRASKSLMRSGSHGKMQTLWCVCTATEGYNEKKILYKGKTLRGTLMGTADKKKKLVNQCHRKRSAFKVYELAWVDSLSALYGVMMTLLYDLVQVR
ncbi:unnamed protein product [Ilex paraguariensis]|uniref:Uncharacterized protein n=1 Tax=Ilex paraguariensis TaxID=185542 RepID=A0ABC8QQN9_9AQUA